MFGTGAFFFGGGARERRGEKVGKEYNIIFRKNENKRVKMSGEK